MTREDYRGHTIPRKLHWITILIVPIVIFSMWLAYSYNFHETQVYPIDVISIDLQKVDGDMSIQDKAGIMSQAHSALLPYNGNYQWPFPTPYNDIDKTKVLLSDTTQEALMLVNIAQLDNFAYQQGIINVNTHINDVANRIDSYGHTLGWNPYYNPVGWILGFMIPGGMMLSVIAVVISDRMQSNWYKKIELEEEHNKKPREFEE